jgi:hypothetical protein
MPKMYDELAAWWPLLSAPVDYQEEAAFYANTLASACARPIRAVLELGSGGGNNASHMKTWWPMTLVEPSAGMRAVSEALNPDLEHLAGDMRTIRVEHDRHVEGLFARVDWIRWLSDAGFVDARSVPFEHSELEPGSHEVFVARRPDA